MPKNLIYIILISIICSSCDLKSAGDYYNLAFDLEEKGEYAKAIVFLDKAIEKNPKFRPALLNRGADKSIIGDYEGAIEDFKKIIEFDADNTLVLVNIGNNYKRLNKYESAIQYYNEALKTERAVKPLSIRIDLEFDKSFDKRSDYEVMDYMIYYERGITYSKSKKFESAIEDLKKSIEYEFEVANAHVWIGESYLALQDTLNACQHLKISAELGIIEARELSEKNCVTNI